MKRIAIFGVGLIGGSFALALRKAGFTGEIHGVSSPATIETAKSMGVIDSGMEAGEAAESCDFLYLAQPILTIIQTLETIGARIRPDALATDAGSTKRLIVETAARSVTGGFFLGGHPMAGKERSGVREAEAGLFEGRTYVLTPADKADLTRPAAAEFISWLERIGARIVYLEPDQHDRMVAFTSHAPQLISTALAGMLADVDGHGDVAGPGVTGMTRLAMSPFGLWRDILRTNQAHVEEALAEIETRLSDLRARLSSGDLELEFERAAEVARRLRQK